MTTGTIKVPGIPTVTSINDVLPSGHNVYLSVANKYTAKWSVVDADLVKVDYYDYETDKDSYGYTTGSSFDLNSRYGHLYLYGVNGFNFETGTAPNVTGDYGDGYVSSTSESYDSSVYLNYLNETKSLPIKSATVASTKSLDIFGSFVKRMNNM